MHSPLSNQVLSRNPNINHPVSLVAVLLLATAAIGWVGWTVMYGGDAKTAASTRLSHPDVASNRSAIHYPGDLVPRPRCQPGEVPVISTATIGQPGETMFMQLRVEAIEEAGGGWKLRTSVPGPNETILTGPPGTPIFVATRCQS